MNLDWKHTLLLIVALVAIVFLAWKEPDAQVISAAGAAIVSLVALVVRGQMQLKAAKKASLPPPPPPPPASSGAAS
jgi:hypothetical protein